MQKPTTTSPYYAPLVAQLSILCDDFHYATLRAELAATVRAADAGR